MNIKFTLALPSYKEEENLFEILPRIIQALNSTNSKYEILVIDTSWPMDNTQKVCAQYGVKYVQRQGGNSYGDAVRTAIHESEGDYLIFMDADGSHTPEFIVDLIRNLGENDVVIASRYVENGATENPMSLVIMSKLVNLTYSLVLGLNCKDVSNSFKLYKTHKLKKLNLKCNNFDIVEEILFKLKKMDAHIKLKEIPFLFKKRLHGKTKRNLISFVLTYVITILKLRFGS